MARRRRLPFAAALAAALALALPGAAPAADPGRWALRAVHRMPLEYFQGIASDASRDLFFDGVFEGLYRTDQRLRETGRVDNAIPPEVALREGYNHIGDIAWDRREGGRVLLPLECFAPGQQDTNPCDTGSFGVADPRTLRLRYYVKLDPAQIPKAMWVAVSPDGRFLWTQAGDDLLAYRAADVARRNAAPGATPLRAARRLRGAVPPSGITGAVFYGGRLFVAGQGRGPFQVWSLDLATGARRLEIERRIAGESEGLDVVDALDGVLHWIVTPFGVSRPTFGTGRSALLSFVPRGGQPLGLAAAPARALAGTTLRVRLTVTADPGVAPGGIEAATVSLAGRTARTDARGRATLTVRLARAGRYTARASKPGFRAATAVVTATSRARG